MNIFGKSALMFLTVHLLWGCGRREYDPRLIGIWNSDNGTYGLNIMADGECGLASGSDLRDQRYILETDERYIGSPSKWYTSNESTFSFVPLDEEGNYGSWSRSKYTLNGSGDTITFEDPPFLGVDTTLHRVRKPSKRP